MKKIFLLLLIVITELSLVGCDPYFDKTKYDMELIDIKVYDKDGAEVVGKYLNYYSEIIQLNSAAPIEKYYVVDGVENESYKVKLIFYSKKGYSMTKLLLENSYKGSRYKYRDDDYNIIEVSNIDKEDENIVVTLDIDKISTENCLYTTIKWYENDSLHNFNTQGSNTYIRGVYFKLPSLNKVLC